ncbi:hypothetical protein FACS1894211_15660 [Clostridia bacterium]|nr:hypothetical protein FACS1894211_15660 [Clostridia bacterium]
MATAENRVQFTISDEELRQALQKALKSNFLDNLRDRNPFVKLDSAIRGNLGEICFSKWLTQNGIEVAASNQMNDGSDIDIDFSFNNETTKDIRLELKTSLIPDVWKTLDEVMQKADIKIIKRPGESVASDIKSDFHAQIYFNRLTKQRDAFLKAIKGVPTDYSEDSLLSVMDLSSLRQAFVAWIDKPTLVAWLNLQTQKTWQFSFRNFWRCPLHMAKEPTLLPDAIRNYKR